MKKVLPAILLIILNLSFIVVPVTASTTVNTTLRPTGAGDETNIPTQTPGTGDHWDKLDEVTSDDDATMLSCAGSTNTTYRDLYAITPGAEPGTVNSVAIYGRLKDNGPPPPLDGDPFAWLVIKTHGTVYEYIKTITTSWVDYSQTFTTNPYTSAAWTWSEIQALQIGIKLQLYQGTYVDYTSRCTQLYIVVNTNLPPAITAKAASNVAFQNARLNATITEGGNDTSLSVRFGYGLVSQAAVDFDNYTTVTAWVSGYQVDDDPYVNVVGLSGSSVYYYRAQVKSASIIVTSTNEIMFETNDGIAALTDYTIAPDNATILSTNPLMPPQMYTELDTSKVIIGGAIDDLLADGGLTGASRALWWYPLIFLGISILSLIIYGLTSKNAEGSLLSQCIVIESCLVLFGIMGAIGVSSLIPLWPAFIFPLGAITWMIAKKQFGW